MISLSSELGVGLGGGLEEEIMEEESDWEEESTHSYVSCVDPDVALSYIDEKLENVLGHFQKDFEGGVSAENLGAKFGGYGSFLSMYQRSSLLKSPPEVQNHVVVTVNFMPHVRSVLQGVLSNYSASSVVPSGSTSKAPASDVSVKLKKFLKSSNEGTPDSKHKTITKPDSKHKPSSSAPSNHKTLRLRIKVGSSDFSSLKNISINSKQGLNMPLTTSRVNCLSEVEEGLLHGSPSKILMAMVSFPLHKDQLLSPLSNDLIQLGQKEKIMKDGGYYSVNKSDSKSTQDVLGVSDTPKCTGKFPTGKKEKLNERIKYMPPSNGIEANHIVSNTEKEADNQSSEDLVSKTLKLPLLSCASPSYIHLAKEFDKVSGSYVESTLRETYNTDLGAALMGSKPELENNIGAFPDQSVKETESVTLNSDYSSVVKVSQNETRNEEKKLKSKLPNARKSPNSSSSIVAVNSLRVRDAAVNISNNSVPDKLHEDIGGSKDVYKGFVGDSGESKEEKQISSVLKAEKEKFLEESSLKESFNSVKNNEEVHLECELGSKNLIKSGDLSEDRHSTKQRFRWEGKNKHSVEGEMENLGMEAERGLSGTSKKQKTGKSRFFSVDRPRSNEVLEDVACNKTMITQASAKKYIAKASLHDEHDDIKRKLKESKETGDCVESSGEHDRKKRRLKGSSCDGKKLPFSSKSCDRDREVSQQNGRDNESCDRDRGLGSEIIEINVHEAKGTQVESFARSDFRALDPPRELKSGRNSERGEHHDTDSNAGDTLKRWRDDESYTTIDKPGTTNKAAEISKDNNQLITGQPAHLWDKERAFDENGSVKKYKPKKSARYSGENFPEGESQRKKIEEGSSARSKDSKCGTANEVQDPDTTVEVKTKESRSKKRPAKKVSMESHKQDSREYQDPSTKLDINGSHFSSTKTLLGKSNHSEVTADKLKDKSAPPAVSDEVEVLGHGSEISDTKKQIIRHNNHRVTHGVGSQNQKQNGSRHKDHVGLSPLEKESTSQAVSNSIKEAKDLKHMADRLKNAGSNHECMGVYFQAALKFLHGVFLLESSSTEHATHKNIARSRDIYGSTAKLCKFCAHEYEKNKDMGAAALAYKCESPSFASDSENSNHTLAVDKVALSNTVRSSPRVTGNQVISSGSNTSLSQLLAFSENASYAMETSRKAQNAHATAKVDTRYSNDGLTSIKRALDFSFQDIEKLLHVVRLAMECINR